MVFRYHKRDHAATIISFVLLTTDYIAEMYDPHPESPGPWFKRHFHRALDNSEGEDECVVERRLNKCVVDGISNE